MSKFFSVISDGKGNVDYFKPEEVVKIMFEGNSKNYDFNSHTSLCHFREIIGAQEDKWNKWEYDPETEKLTRDTKNAKDDSKVVEDKLKEFFKNKDIIYIRNLFGSNSGNWNSGDRNSGDGNSGNWNSGNWNSGNWNSGNWNSGDGNSGYGSNGVFCTIEPEILIFNKPSGITLKQWRYSDFQLLFNSFAVIKWIRESNMTDQEKIDNPDFHIAGGFLKRIDYKEACKNWWDSLSVKDKKKVQTIPNFDSGIFEKITGINI